MRTPYTEFIAVARLLNTKMGIVPVLYGSLGLEIVSGALFEPQDIDMLVPAVHLRDRWEEFRRVIESIGYVLADEKEHEFVKDGMRIAFAEEEELFGFAGVDARRLAAIEARDARYRSLTLEEYLRVYERSLTDGYRREKNNGKDLVKIERIKRLIDARRTNVPRFAAKHDLTPLEKLILVLVLTALGSIGYYFFGGPPRPTPTGEEPPAIQVTEEPYQRILEEDEVKVLYDRDDGFTAFSLAEYRIAGSVLSVSVNQAYEGESVYPIDVGLIWGKPARSGYETYLKYHHARSGMSETNRTLWVSFKGPVPPEVSEPEVMDHISNSHIFPANGNIYNAAAHLEEGEDVLLEGYLLRTEWPGGFTKNSSLSRTDRDCEDFYVTRIVTGKGVYE